MCIKNIRVPYKGLPEIVYAGFQPVDTMETSLPRGPENLYCLYVHIDSGELLLNSCEYEVSPGDITCLPAQPDIRFRGSSKGHQWAFRFLLPEVNGAGSFELPFLASMKGLHHPILQECGRIAAGFNAPASDPEEKMLNKQIASARFYSFLMRMARMTRGEMHKSDIVLHGMLERLESSLGDKVSIPQIAEEAGVSQTYLSTLFRQRFGVTINQYMHQRRIEQAKELLSRTNLPVSSIGDEIGMGDPQYFNKQFRKTVGMSPSNFRKTASS